MQSLRDPLSSRPRGMRASPCASVRPDHSVTPRQSLTATSAPATGCARSSVVTQTRLSLRPRLKCTPIGVTSTPVRTYIGASRSSSARPSTRDDTSTTW